VKAIVEGKLDEAGLTAAERALLEYVELITRAAYRSTPEDVEKLRVAGLKEKQISEAVYITACSPFSIVSQTRSVFLRRTTSEPGN
jgi:alkylhydroperoxidase family enzyme